MNYLKCLDVLLFYRENKYIAPAAYLVPHKKYGFDHYN